MPICCIFTSVVSKLFWLWWNLCIRKIEHLVNWTNKGFCAKEGSLLITQITCRDAGCPMNIGSLLTILLGRQLWFSSSQHWVQLFLWDFPCPSSEFTWVISISFYRRHFLCDFKKHILKWRWNGKIIPHFLFWIEQKNYSWKCHHRIKFIVLCELYLLCF